MAKHYEDRACSICGKSFTPRRINQITCGSEECVKANKRKHEDKWKMLNYQRSLDAHRDYNRRKRNENNAKPDTIVAKGYAERQVAASLALAGKVNTEL